jgi:sister-chromatid-cohesion protein PDS5
MVPFLFTEQVKIRQHDAEETVRQEVVNTLLNIAKKNFAATTPEMLEVIKERTRDKKVNHFTDPIYGNFQYIQHFLKYKYQCYHLNFSEMVVLF